MYIYIASIHFVELISFLNLVVVPPRRSKVVRTYISVHKVTNSRSPGVDQLVKTTTFKTNRLYNLIICVTALGVTSFFRLSKLFNYKT